jgi:two-component system sensor histidine kinase HydH
MPPSAQIYAFLGLTALLAGLVAVMVFAGLRFLAAARNTRRRAVAATETSFMADALAQAVGKLKAQERAMAARADASERLSGEIISSLTAGLLVVGLDRSVTILNPAGRRMLDIPEEAPLADYTRLLAPPLAGMIAECLATRAAIVRRTIEMPDASGASHLGVTVSPLFDHEAKLQGAICLFSDLTAFTELEAQLRLKQSLAAVGELTAGIAHEFRNGLATIQGYSKLINVDSLPGPHREYVEGIRAETASLSQVVTNFLNFARPAQLTLGSVDLRTLCDRAADEIRADALALGGAVDVGGHFGSIDGDEVLLRQAFSNLLRNAFEACRGASIVPMITIFAEIDPGQQIVRIAVDDNGPGIEPAARERVFQPFYTSKHDGTGLGLALVQKIVVFHNGRVTVGRSALGGASLQVMLPVTSPRS